MKAVEAKLTIDVLKGCKSGKFMLKNKIIEELPIAEYFAAFILLSFCPAIIKFKFNNPAKIMKQRELPSIKTAAKIRELLVQRWPTPCPWN